MARSIEHQVKARWWTYRQQLLGRAAASVESALHDVIAVYSSHPSAPLSLWARTTGFSADAFRTLESKRMALRIPAMRQSIFLLTKEDAAMAFAATRVPFAKLLPRLQYAKVSAKEYPKLKAAILDAASVPLTPEQLRSATGESDSRVTTLARVIACEGDVLRIGAESVRSNNLRYVATAAWGKGLLDAHDADAALNTLADRYLRAFGPARVKDFQWWAGITKSRAAAALATLDTTTLPDGSLIHGALFDAFARVTAPPDDAIDILPKWDCYTMGYAPDGRARFVSPDMQSRVYVNVGDGLGTVLLGGQAVASWSSSFSGQRMDVVLDLFEPSAKSFLPKIKKRFEEVAAVLGGDACRVNMAGGSLADSLGFNRVRKSSGN